MASASDFVATEHGRPTTGGREMGERERRRKKQTKERGNTLVKVLFSSLSPSLTVERSMRVKCMHAHTEIDRWIIPLTHRTYRVTKSQSPSLSHLSSLRISHLSVIEKSRLHRVFLNTLLALPL
jgi:hypothetical protein